MRHCRNDLRSKSKLCRCSTHERPSPCTKEENYPLPKQRSSKVASHVSSLSQVRYWNDDIIRGRLYSLQGLLQQLLELALEKSNLSFNHVLQLAEFAALLGNSLGLGAFDYLAEGGLTSSVVGEDLEYMLSKAQNEAGR
jgi:hypothetical protein